MKDLHLARAIWKKFHPMIIHSIPAPSANCGRPRVNERRVFFGICYLLWSGCPWRALPRKYGSKSTVHRYFKKWAESGLFRKLWHSILVFLNEKGVLSNEIHIVDGSHVLNQQLLKKEAFVSFKNRPKRAIKFSLLVDSEGIPLAT